MGYSLIKVAIGVGILFGLCAVYKSWFKVASDADDKIENATKENPLPKSTDCEELPAGEYQIPDVEPTVGPVLPKEDEIKEITDKYIDKPIEDSVNDAQFKDLYNKYKNKEIAAKSAYESLGWSKSKFYREVKKYENYKALERANIKGEENDQ